MFKQFFALAVIICSCLAARPSLAATHTPKLLNLFLGTQLSDKDVTQLARWDVVVLDFDQAWRNPARARELRRLNPTIKILAYISASEINQSRLTQDPRSPGYQLAKAIDSTWYVKRVNGQRAQWWPGASLIDPTDGSPRSRLGQRWNTFLPQFIKTKILATGLWDGVFLDGAYGYVTANYGNDLNLAHTKTQESPEIINQRFFEGMTKLIQNVCTAIGSDKLLMNNSGERYAWLVNGVLFENVPQYGWTLPFNLAQDMSRQNQTPVLTAINSNTANKEEQYNYQAMRLGLATALVADTYFSFDAGDANHDRTWWYDEYAADLGTPIGAPILLQSVSSTTGETHVWGRAYAQGFVIANPTDQAVDIRLPTNYQHLNGIQDPITNNNQIAQTFRVWAQDGVVLKTPVARK